MPNSLFITALYSFAFLALFAIAEVLHLWLKIKAEWTRKLVHATSGLIALTFPLYLDNHWNILFLTVSFVFILVISLKFDFLRSINNVTRVTHGSVIFPLVIYGCFFTYNISSQTIYFYIPLIILAIGDPIANIVGKKIPIRPYVNFGHTKTMSGSLGFLIAALICSFLFLEAIDKWSTTFNLIVALSISIISTTVEAFSHRGFDNLSIPLSCIFVLFIFDYFIFVL